MSAQELYQGYLNVYRQVYSLKNIIRRLPRCKQQRIPYLLFALACLRCCLCHLILYGSESRQFLRQFLHLCLCSLKVGLQLLHVL